MSDRSVTASSVSNEVDDGKTSDTSSIASSAVTAVDTVVQEATSHRLVTPGPFSHNYTVTLSDPWEDLGMGIAEVEGRVCVRSVDPDGPTSHLPCNRLVTAVDGFPILDVDGLNQVLYALRGRGSKSFTMALSDLLTADTRRTLNVRLVHSTQSLGLGIEMVQGVAMVTQVDPRGAFAHAGAMEGAILHSLGGTEVRSTEDLHRAVAGVRRRGALEFEAVVTLRRGAPSHPPLRGTGAHAAPPASRQEAEAREVLRREALARQRSLALSSEKRVDPVNGHAMTLAGFTRNYGEGTGRRRWEEAAGRRTAVVAMKNLTPTQELTAGDAGRRVQVEETGVVCIAAFLGSAGCVVWQEVPLDDMTPAEKAVFEAVDPRGRSSLPTPLDALPQASQPGQRAQILETGEVVSVGQDLSWHRVPKSSWSAAESRYALKLGSSSPTSSPPGEYPLPLGSPHRPPNVRDVYHRAQMHHRIKQDVLS